MYVFTAVFSRAADFCGQKKSLLRLSALRFAYQSESRDPLRMIANRPAQRRVIKADNTGKRG
jgi:hypothetical protein